MAFAPPGSASGPFTDLQRALDDTSPPIGISTAGVDALLEPALQEDLDHFGIGPIRLVEDELLEPGALTPYIRDEVTGSIRPCFKLIDPPLDVDERPIVELRGHPDTIAVLRRTMTAP